MIGAKALTSLVLLVCGLLGALVSGVLRPAGLLVIQPGTAFFIGSFALVIATFAFRFWKLDERSAHYFRWESEWQLWEGESHFLGTRGRRVTVGDNASAEAFDLPPAVQFSICLLLSLILCVAAFDARSLTLLTQFKDGFKAAGSTYCPDPEEQAQQEDTSTVDPGCALVRRAYALGYADSLGECGPKKKAAVAAVCTLRQRDEPLLHYAFRKLDEFVTQVRAPRAPVLSGPAFGSKPWREHLGLLLGAHGQVMSTAVHASHHIWTNLPDPKDGAFEARTCVDRYRALAHRPNVNPSEPLYASRVFEHVVGQLLFETRYEPAAGYCREYQVHWGAPVDACRQLAESPEAFLRESDALEPVRTALRRYQLAGQVESQPKQMRSPQEFISFSCYMEGEPNAQKDVKVALDGYTFTARELLAPRPAEENGLAVARYGQVASLLAPGFHYGVLLSEAGLDLGRIEGAGFAEAFAAKDYPLSRLHGLASLDIFLEPQWISSRQDLLEVYPYHLHLKNYVQLFRRQYARHKGRL